MRRDEYWEKNKDWLEDQVPLEIFEKIWKDVFGYGRGAGFIDGHTKGMNEAANYYDELAKGIEKRKKQMVKM